MSQKKNVRNMLLMVVTCLAGVFAPACPLPDEEMRVRSAGDAVALNKALDGVTTVEECHFVDLSSSDAPEIAKKIDAQILAQSGVREVESTRAEKEMTLFLSCLIADDSVEGRTSRLSEVTLAERVAKCVLQTKTLSDESVFLKAATILGRIRKKIVVGYVAYPHCLSHVYEWDQKGLMSEKVDEKVERKNREGAYQANLRTAEHLILQTLYVAMLGVYERLASSEERKRFEKMAARVADLAGLTEEEANLFKRPSVMHVFEDEKTRWRVRDASTQMDY